MTTRIRSSMIYMPNFNFTRVDKRVRHNASTTYTTVSNAPISTFGRNGTEMTDVVTKGFKTLSAQGKIINNPMTRVEDSCQVSAFNGVTSSISASWINSTPSTGATLHYESVVTNLLFLPSIDMFNLFEGHMPGLAQQASNEAIAASHQRNVLGIVDLMEADKTFELLVSNLRRLETIIRRQPLRKLRKGKIKNGSLIQKYKARTPEGVVADLLGLHLEYHYGVLPLMMTIEGLMKTFSDRITAPPIRQTFRGSQSDSDREETSTSIQISTINPAVPGPMETSTFIRERFSYARAGVLTEYKPSLQAMLGMELRDIPTAAYELIKFSFVLDWFFDLNTYLEAVIPVPGYSSLATWVKQETKEIISYTTSRGAGSAILQITGTGTPKPIYQQNQSIPSHQHGISWTRTYTTRTPGISAGLPTIDLKFRSTTHAISAVALAVSSARKTGLARL